MISLSTKLLLFTLSFLAVRAHDHAHNSCSATPPRDFYEHKQHADCDYADPQQLATPSTAAEHRNDVYWLNVAYEYALRIDPLYPFGALVVDSRNNSLVCIGANQRATSNETDIAFLLHAEIVTIRNCVRTRLPDVGAPGAKSANPEWQYMVFYGTVEACPMCAQAMIWETISAVRYGARASVLQERKCWTQSNTTQYEIYQQSSHFLPIKSIRGPFPEIEDRVVDSFESFC
jgi:tRNA(Arg) A34 adenosine deaminase TadA